MLHTYCANCVDAHPSEIVTLPPRTEGDPVRRFSVCTPCAERWRQTRTWDGGEGDGVPAHLYDGVPETDQPAEDELLSWPDFVVRCVEHPQRGRDLTSLCPRCGSAPMSWKDGPYSQFLGCDAYPHCPHIERREKRVTTR